MLKSNEALKRERHQKLLSHISNADIRRATEPAFETDNAAGAFALLADGERRRIPGALITIVGIEAGAPRALGAHMAVLSDGTYCGYVSGGCVEAAIAGEALEVLRSGKDAVLRFGLGSPFMDIRLPCGGGIDVHVHVNPAAALIGKALDGFSRRQAFAIEFSPDDSSARLVPEPDSKTVSGWAEGVFSRRYQPATRLVVIGRGLEFETMLRMSRSAGLELAAFTPDDQGVRLAQSLGVHATTLAGIGDAPPLPIDIWTAVIFLFHDHEWEEELLAEVLDSGAYYVGALGSRATHAARCTRLRDRGLTETAIARVHGPVGMFGPTRNATALAVSVLAQVIEERRQFDQS